MITSPDLAALILLWSTQDCADCRGILQRGAAGMGTAIRFGIMNNNNSSQSFPVPSCSNSADDNGSSQSFPIPMAAPAKNAASSKKAAKKVVADPDCPFYFRPVVAQEESGMSDLEAGSMGFR